MAPGQLPLAAEAEQAAGPALLTCSTPHCYVQTPVSGWLEAFAAHPKIGDLEGLRKKYGGAFGAMSAGEQADATGAPEAVLQVRLPDGGSARTRCSVGQDTTRLPDSYCTPSHRQHRTWQTGTSSTRPGLATSSSSAPVARRQRRCWRQSRPGALLSSPCCCPVSSVAKLRSVTLCSGIPVGLGRLKTPREASSHGVGV